MLVAALLQYFFLVSFMAMAAEAFNLYMKLVVVLGSKISHYALKAAIICWGKQKKKYILYMLTHAIRIFNMSTPLFN